jgi:hypothetical protein
MFTYEKQKNWKICSFQDHTSFFHNFMFKINNLYPYIPNFICSILGDKTMYNQV